MKLLRILIFCWKELLKLKQYKNEKKEQKGRFLSMLLGTLWASLLENSLSREGIVRAAYRNKKEWQGLVMQIKWISNAASSFNKP